jgi:hypothetical protein
MTRRSLRWLGPGAGLRLVKIADLMRLADMHPEHSMVPEGDRFPRFMLLGPERPERAVAG